MGELKITFSESSTNDNIETDSILEGNDDAG